MGLQTPAGLQAGRLRLQVSSVRLREDVIEAEIFGQRTLLPGPLARSRTLFISYLDEDILIVR